MLTMNNTVEEIQDALILAQHDFIEDLKSTAGLRETALEAAKSVIKTQEEMLDQQAAVIDSLHEEIKLYKSVVEIQKNKIVDYEDIIEAQEEELFPSGCNLDAWVFNELTNLTYED